MVEGFLLDGITLKGTYISTRNPQYSLFVISDPADTLAAFRNAAEVTTGITADPIIWKGVVEFTNTGSTFQDIFKGDGC
jgi:hypothetical protein